MNKEQKSAGNINRVSGSDVLDEKRSFYTKECWKEEIIKREEDMFVYATRRVSVRQA